MIEDKLNHQERIRLECIAQAVAHNAMRHQSAEVIVQTAKTFEEYVTGVDK